ncbi:MAG: sulfatase-like hydrolase/transferase [Proteobacteria bacterium]|nr:sulfatase-like hydrolase/transferase [Pseudomonadota bacterium]
MKPLIVFLVALAFWIIDAILQSFLYFGVSPFGAPYTQTPYLYVLALYWSAFVALLVMLPYFITAFFIKRRFAVLYIFEVLSLALMVACTHADHEFMRFTGTHYSLEMIETYSLMSGGSLFVIDAIKADTRGAYSSVILLFVPILLATLMILFRRRIIITLEKIPLSRRQSRIVLIALCCLILGIVGSGFHSFAKTNDFSKKFEMKISRRQKHVVPFYVILASDLYSVLRYGGHMSTNVVFTQEEIETAIERVRESWQTANEDPNWVFDEDSARPLLKHYYGDCPQFSETSPNIVMIVIESLRAADLQAFNSESTRQVMPFFDSLIRGTAPVLNKHGLKAAYFSRFFTNGQPTIDAFMAIHTGLPPHSYKTVGTRFSFNNLQSFVDILRNNDYYTIFIAGGDPDFDGERIWMKRWYDRLVQINTWDDRKLLDSAFNEIKQSVSNSKTYKLGMWLTTNHVPFKLPADCPVPNAGASMAERRFWTLKFADDALEKFFAELDEAGLMDNTIFILTSDHGYDFGEHVGTPHDAYGFEASRQNVSWIPLVILSNSPNFVAGERTSLGSHADLAPTILELANICASNSFLGHSLFRSRSRTALNCKYGNFSYHTDDASAIFIAGDVPQLYEAQDRLQKTNQAALQPDRVESMRRAAVDVRMVIDYGYAHDLFFKLSK